MSYDKLIIERNVEAVMRDGVILRANVYRPDAEGRFPVLLPRTPYNKDGAGDFPQLSAARGYAVVVQDTRGRWASDGDHYPLRDEFNDGYDTVQWAAAQPWSSGSVGMWGGSYVGWTQWAAAATQPPALKTIFPLYTFTDPYGDLYYPGGALSLGVIVSWMLGAGASVAIPRLDVSAEEKKRLVEELADALDGLATGRTFNTLPLTDMPLVSRPELAGQYPDLLAHPNRDGYWDDLDIRQRLSQIAIPAYHMVGWYDIFISGSLADYTDMRQRAGSESARQAQRLMVGPWLHGPLTGVSGEVDFGFRGSDASVLTWEIMWRWFDHWLKGEQNGVMEEAPVKLFVMGRNRWRDEQEWPLARTQYTPWYLHSAGSANSAGGDGVLSPTQPAAEPTDAYAYDPRKPVPTRGGGLCCWQAALPAGAFDQRAIEERQDVLVYTSEMLEEDLEVTGPLQVTLYAASSAVDTDFTAKLVDVLPCGYARNVADGIVRARYRHDARQSKPLTPGAVEQYTIDLAGTSNVFLAGHRIRIEIASSNYPRFERNPNTGHPVNSADEMIVAQQTIYHDAEHPSHILLPIIPA